jgi:hypothetical protein
MEIKLNTNIDSVARMQSGPKPAREARSSPGSTAGFESSQALDKRLSETPAARPDTVERAKALIGDPAYPPRETIDSISNLLAIKLELATSNV